MPDEGRPAHERALGRALLDRDAAGEDITVRVDGRLVAKLVPPDARQRWMLRNAFIARILRQGSDSGPLRLHHSGASVIICA
jgi:antitoxin (DNA-binding transcriptional repressor) of toxin-antitoxin stability system